MLLGVISAIGLPYILLASNAHNDERYVQKAEYTKDLAATAHIYQLDRDHDKEMRESDRSEQRRQFDAINVQLTSIEGDIKTLLRKQKPTE